MGPEGAFWREDPLLQSNQLRWPRRLRTTGWRGELINGPQGDFMLFREKNLGDFISRRKRNMPLTCKGQHSRRFLHIGRGFGEVYPSSTLSACLVHSTTPKKLVLSLSHASVSYTTIQPTRNHYQLRRRRLLVQRDFHFYPFPPSLWMAAGS